jgi:hypothetical protein
MLSVSEASLDFQSLAKPRFFGFIVIRMTLWIKGWRRDRGQTVKLSDEENDGTF